MAKGTISLALDHSLIFKLEQEAIDNKVKVSAVANKILTEHYNREYETVKCKDCGAVYSSRYNKCPQCKLTDDEKLEKENAVKDAELREANIKRIKQRIDLHEKEYENDKLDTRLAEIRRWKEKLLELQGGKNATNEGTYAEN